MAALQTKRLAAASDTLTDRDIVAEANQFLATLLLLQGISGIDPVDKNKLVSKLRLWKRRPQFAGHLASEASERVLGCLTEDASMGPLLSMVRSMLEASVKKCAAPGCDLTQEDTNLMKCSRCKTTLYCGAPHQKQSWRAHKPLCFEPAF